MPHQVDDALLHAMSGTELSRVRTELRLLPPEPINEGPLESRAADIVMQSSGHLRACTSRLDRAKLKLEELASTFENEFYKGRYVGGCGDAKERPKFYEHLGMHQGTINIQMSHDVAEEVLICRGEIVPGLDPIDHNQNFRISKVQAERHHRLSDPADT
jgi:hypothetical protein